MKYEIPAVWELQKTSKRKRDKIHKLNLNSKNKETQKKNNKL